MTNTLLDLSDRFDLKPLAAVVRALQPAAAASGSRFFLMGAAARDLMLQHVHGIAPKRITEDVDFGVMVENWEAFHTLRNALLASGAFQAAAGKALHKLLHKSTRLPLDIVPFGGVERADRTIAWPPTQDEVFDCFGAKEALEASVAVLLPGEVKVQCASIPALALLKITAWRDRKLTHPGRDAVDLGLYMSSYLDCGNMDRAATEHQDLYAAADFDHEATGSRLLGRDIAKLLDHQAITRMLEILTPETDPDGALVLVQQAKLELEHGRQLVAALCKGLADEHKKAAK